jgi:aromatase
VVEALDANSAEELAAVARVAELGVPLDEICVDFTDTVEVPGPPENAYAFIDRADRWPDLLPHVARVDLREDGSGAQHLAMDTVTADGSAHTTSSVRLCFPHDRIVYKQLVPPALLLGHAGSWHFAAGDHGVTVVAARHQIAVDPAAVAGVLGAGTTLAAARDHARRALGANSRATLAHAGGRATTR